ncbi:MAG: hypothetical protein ACE5KM_08250 [Planctomycetaceae bacterium]
MSDTAHALNGPHFVVSMQGDVLGEDTLENRDIVRRIHACVNACDGISTEELEGGIIADMRSVLAQVVPVLQQREGSQPRVVARSVPVSEVLAEGAD